MDQIVIPREATAKQVLAAIDAWAWAKPKPSRFGGEQERKMLWHVLTAMRGPDSENDTLKEATTAVIRAAALPNLALHGGGIIAEGNVPARLAQLANYTGERDSWHFADHIRLAAGALNYAEVTS